MSDSNSTPPPPSLKNEEQVLAQAVADLSSLGRVSHKLAMTDAGAPLQKVLSLLLPRLLVRVGTNHVLQQEYASTKNTVLKETLEKIHQKLIETLSHIIQRVRHDDSIQLPISAILQLLYDTTTHTPNQHVNAFTMNLTLTFLNLGIARCKDYSTVESLLPGLLVLLGQYSGVASQTSASLKSQSHQISHLLLQVIQKLVMEEKVSSRVSSPPSSSTLLGSKVGGNNEVENTNNNNKTNMETARNLIASNPDIASALFDLYMDCLLYQPSFSKTMPPPGLSQAGHERLLSNKEWFSGVATNSQRLMEWKVNLLNFILPTRQWAIFMTSQENIARTVALLVVATGDVHATIVERATLVLKTHFDCMREQSKETLATFALGNPLSLSCTLTSLVLGTSNAESVLRQVNTTTTSDLESLSLGRTTTTNTTQEQYSSQTILANKRRMACDQTAAAIMSFVSSKVLDDNPLWLESVGESEVKAFSTLACMSANKLLSTTGTSTLSTLRATPYIAAAQLLNSLVIRLLSLESPPLAVLSKALSTVCTVLTQAATPRPTCTPGTFEGSIAMRDKCYGVVCATSRSQSCESFIFSSGQMNDDNDGSTTSMDTAKLLFGCAANEEETLRPRAVAALDALLGAYCRVHVTPTLAQVMDEQDTSLMEIDTAEVVNPWSQSATVSDAKMHVDNNTTSPKNSEGLAKALLPLLWGAAQSSQPKASRVAAARWSSDLLKTLDLPNACHILCFLAGDKDVTAASIAREGLGLDKTIGEAYNEQLNEGMILPDFSDLTVVLFSESSRSTPMSSWRPRFFDFSHHGKAAALRFSLACLLSDLYGGEDDAVAAFVNALCETLAHFGTASGGRGPAHGRESIDLLDECSICLAGCMSTSRFARSLILSGQTPFGLEDMETLAILADSSKARRYLAEACGRIYEDQDLWQSAPGVDVGLVEWMEKCKILRPLKACAKSLVDMQTELFQMGEVHGAAFLGARSCRAFRLLAAKKEIPADASIDACWAHVNSIIEALGRGTVHSEEVIGNAFSQGLSIALSYDGANAPILDSRIYAGTTSALTHLDVALRKYGNGDHTDETRASSLAEAAGVVLAASTSAAGFSDNSTPNRSVGPARIQCVDALFTLIGSNAFRKDPEVALKAGEALADYSDAYGPDSAVWSSEETDWPDTYSEEYANELPPHQQVLYILLRRELKVSSPHKRTAVAPALLAIVGRAARLANSDKEMAKRALVVEVVQRLAEIQTAFITLLADPKSKQLARESCCIGLAACQGIAQAVARTDMASKMKLSDELNDSLLRAFGQTTNFGGSAMMETRAQNAERRQRNNQESGATSSLTEQFGLETEAAEVGGAAGLGEAALGAYREMAAAALALGRSDVLYALFLLSISHPVWFTAGPRDRYSASALLGEFSLIGSRTNAAEMREALRPHLSKLIPRMLRACHDPNKQTREQMNTLWVGVTGGGAEARAAITENLLPTIDILMEDASSKLWRARVGACGALAEVIVGRSWDDLGGGAAILDDDDVFIKTSTFSTIAAVRLLRLWRVAMRALDDVRLSVRESGETLVRSVRSLTIRLCDPSALLNTPNGGPRPTAEAKQKAEDQARAAAETSLRWLVKNGLNQPCAEAVGACVSTLLGIVDVVNPITLQPVLSDLIGALLMAMSGLEPAALNYLQVRSAGRDSEGGDSYERLERARLQMAQSGPIAGALNKCLDMVPSVELAVQNEIVPQLDSALRSGVGFATRAATADAVSSLCTSSPGAFSFPGHGTSNPTVRLLRALYYASEREHGQGARDKMAHALGNIAKLSPGQSVRSLALRACERYTAATGNNDDPTARRAAASALRALAVRASNQLADGGPRDIWCRRVLPLAFLGQKDTDKKVASLWKECWDEGGMATHAVDTPSTGTSSFGVLLEEKLLPDLVRACVDALNDVSWARRVAACTALTELCDQNILAPVARSSKSSAESCSPSELTRSKRRAEASLAALTACVKVLVKPRVWTGKADVVKTVAKIAGQWVVVCSENDSVALGWNEANKPCPWMPLAVSQENFGKDLFAGDGWFEQRHSEMDLSDPDNGLSETGGGNEEEEDVEMDDTDDAKIDFEKGDDILTSDVETEPMKASDDDGDVPLAFSGLCKAILEQAFPNSVSVTASLAEDILPFRSASLAGLSELVQVLSDIPNVTESLKVYQIAVYRMIAPTLLPVIGTEMYLEAGNSDKKPEPPLIIARSLDCLASSFWNGIGKDAGEEHPEEDVLSLSGILRTVGGSKQPAWTVRESSALAAASLATRCSVKVLRNPRLIDNFLESSRHALLDRKFWRVRLAGLELLLALVQRSGDVTTSRGSSSAFAMTGAPTATADAGQQEKQLALEALLPHKETILQLARSTLTDSESKVTSKASEVCSAMTWWP